MTRKPNRIYVQLVPAELQRPDLACDPQRFHVWRWHADADDPGVAPAYGTTCQCGLFEWTPP
jgi:hypothetical protein